MAEIASTVPVENQAPSQDFQIHIGAPLPFEFEIDTGDGVLRSFDNTLRFRAIDKGTGVAIDLSVGNGITLEQSEESDVPNSLVVIRFSRSQSRLVRPGFWMTYEIQEGTAEDETGVLIGRIEGIGGNNLDG